MTDPFGREGELVDLSGVVACVSCRRRVATHRVTFENSDSQLVCEWCKPWKSDQWVVEDLRKEEVSDGV